MDTSHYRQLCWRNRYRLGILAAAIFLVASTLSTAAPATTLRSKLDAFSLPEFVHHSSTNSECTPAFIRVGGYDHAGLGSLVAQLGESFVLSDLVGGQLVLPNTTAWHDFDAADIFNSHLSNVCPIDPKNLCLVSELSIGVDIQSQIMNICKQGKEKAVAGILKRNLEAMRDKCSAWIDDREWSVNRDIGVCTTEWTRDLFRATRECSTQNTVGVHLRYGDLRPGHAVEPTNERWSLSQPTIKKVLAKLNECVGPFETTVHMENGKNETLDIGQAYAIVDTGDPVLELQMLSSYRYLVVGSGGYSHLAHVVSSQGFTAVTAAAWTGYGTNTLVQIDELEDMDCEEIRSAWEDGKVCDA